LAVSQRCLLQDAIRQIRTSQPSVLLPLLLSLQALIHLAPLPGGGIGAADVDVPAAVSQLEQQQQDQKLDFLGPLLPPEVARGIAEGVPGLWQLRECLLQPALRVKITASLPRAHLRTNVVACMPVQVTWTPTPTSRTT
jgi:hypothetical protein